MPVPPRRVRASFVLRCVILGGLAGAILAVAWALWSAGLAVAALAVVLVFVVVHEGLLAIVERLLLRRARAATRPVDSVWVVDLDHEDEERRANFERLTEDNPTLR